MRRSRRLLWLIVAAALLICASTALHSSKGPIGPVFTSGLEWDDGTGGCVQGNGGCAGHVK